MGRDQKEVDINQMLELLSAGVSRKDTAAALGITPPTLDARIEELRKKESSLLAYDKNKYLDLIDVQHRILANVTDDKLLEAPLGQLAQAYGIFGKMEQLVQGRPTEIHGLMGYLMHLEKEDIAAAQGDAIEAEVNDENVK